MQINLVYAAEAALLLPFGQATQVNDPGPLVAFLFLLVGWFYSKESLQRLFLRISTVSVDQDREKTAQNYFKNTCLVKAFFLVVI